jgi:hypothetical protein
MCQEKRKILQDARRAADKNARQNIIIQLLYRQELAEEGNRPEKKTLDLT